jgi:hypothetical protein
MVAPNPNSETNIRFPQSPFLDQRTGYPAREWIVWLQNPNVVSQTVTYQIVTSGEINNTTIGLTVPAAGQFTDLTALNGIGGGTF